MSDSWIVLIPENPRFVPDAEKCQRARDRFAEIAPDAEEIGVRVSKKVEFFDCGENFARVLCPSCRSEIPADWWEGRMEEDSEDGFKLGSYMTYCCFKRCTLNDLLYDWPQGFACFAISAMNPGIGGLHDKYRREFEEILGTKVKVIHRHI